MLRERVIDGECPGPYQVLAADLNRDHRRDIVVTCPGKGLIQWYAAPDWTKRPIRSDLHPGALDCAPYDLDGDGRVELAVIDEFHLDPSTTGGRVLWLHQGRTPEEEWSVHPIDTVPTAHRIRWADLHGDGRKQLIVAPILGPGAGSKNPRSVPASLFYYRVPDDPVRGPWERHTISSAVPLQHGIRIHDVNGDGRDEILSASAAGTILFFPVPVSGGLEFREQHIHTSESSEVYWISRGPNGRPMIATIEPWHGNQVCVYLPVEGGGQWTRVLIDDTLDSGHALWIADVDGDGHEEIIAGYRGKGTSINVYRRQDGDGKRWAKSVLDNHVACEGIFGARITSRHGIDLVACGGTTGNVKLYENSSG